MDTRVWTNFSVPIHMHIHTHRIFAIMRTMTSTADQATKIYHICPRWLYPLSHRMLLWCELSFKCEKVLFRYLYSMYLCAHYKTTKPRRRLIRFISVGTVDFIYYNIYNNKYISYIPTILYMCQFSYSGDPKAPPH